MVWSLTPVGAIAYADDDVVTDDATVVEVPLEEGGDPSDTGSTNQGNTDDSGNQGQPTDGTEDGTGTEGDGGSDGTGSETTDDVTPVDDTTGDDVVVDETTTTTTTDGVAEEVPEAADKQDEAEDAEKAEEAKKSEDAKKDEKKDEQEVKLAAPSATPGLSVQAHVQNIGWQKAVTSGKTAGTSGKALRVEGLKISITGDKTKIPSGSIEYRTHVQNIGWQDWVKDGALAGTSGQALRIEAMQIRLTGELADQYDVYYQVHAQNEGWMAVASNGELTGTSGKAYRLEALRVWLVKKGGAAPNPATDTSKTFDGIQGLKGTAHVQNIGWMGSVGNGKALGTTGKGLRLEAFNLAVEGLDLSGDIRYRAHVQNIGWQGWKKNGQTAGSIGRGLRVEAVEIDLTGELESTYDVYYRAHVSNIGWLAWAKEGETAGSTGMSQRVEALQVQLVKKGDPAPSNDGAAYNQPCIKSATLQYSVKVQGSSSWQGWKKNGQTAGTTGKGLRITGLKATISGESGNILYEFGVQNQVDKGWVAGSAVKNGAECLDNGKRVEIVRLKLSGTVSKTYDIWYRAHVQNLGWSGWGKNGQSVGSKELGYRIESIQIKLVPKGGSAPGATAFRLYDRNGTHYDIYKKAQGYSSSTGYLLMVDTNDCWVGVFTGSRGNWNPKYYWRCSVGKDSTPTIKGVFTTETSSLHFGEEHGYSCWYATQIYGDYLFHSVKFQPGSQTAPKDTRLGRHISMGCVRLPLEDARWIYYNIPDGTTVVTY